MRLTILAAAAMGSVAALVGLAGAANASATVDLIWIDKKDTACTDDDRRDCPRIGTGISSAALGDNITLAVILTAGPGGSIGGGVSVDYGNVPAALSVVGFQSLTTTLPLPYLPLILITATDQPPFIDSINAAAAPPVGFGIGLPAGQSAYLGTVTFHNRADLPSDIVYEITVGTNGPGRTDDVLDGAGNTITTTTTFNSAYLSGDLEPPQYCTDAEGNLMQIEVNALRAGGKTVSAGPNQTVDVTARARILKGTAVPDTTLVTMLTIEAVTPPGGTVIGTNSTGPIALGVGKGGQGAKLAVDTPQCVGGFIEFVATFFGKDQDNDECWGTRTLRKECR